MFHKATYCGKEGLYCTKTGRVKFGDKVFHSIEEAIKFFGK
jgi:hypothetical protein